MLDRHLDGLGRERSLGQLGARLDGDAIAARLHTVGIAPGLPGADVEFPAMPGTVDHLAAAGEVVLAGHGCYQPADDRAPAQGAPLVRAAVDQREIFAPDIE